jgi:hypothetical protein
MEAQIPTQARPAKGLVTITVNNRPVAVPRKTTGAEIKARADVPADFELFRVVGDHEKKVGDDERVTVHPDERFIASPMLQPS